ncbi:MAG: phosphonate C-P lyase system protein PhnG [Deltaproteobacteria bacterium]|nr:phosphonate C-P lyase system protein PhnG [Deltaproteobacteria bacterium]
MSKEAEFFRVDTPLRQEWMAVLAKARPEDLEEAWRSLREKPKYHLLRPHETGLVMVRARAGGTGMQFNLGEMTVTRCTVQVDGGAPGTAYVMGQNRRHAELAALFDALLQDPSRHSSLMESVIRPIKNSIRDRKAMIAKKAASTRVEFFTMVRGD